MRPQYSVVDRESKPLRDLDPRALDSINRLAEELLSTPMPLLHALSDEQLCQLTLLAEQAASLLDMHARTPDVVWHSEPGLLRTVRGWGYRLEAPKSSLVDDKALNDKELNDKELVAR